MTELRRGLIARVRVVGFLEFFSLLPGFGVLLGVVDGSGFRSSDAVAIVVFALLTVGVRALVATEYVRATEEALEWRSLIRRYRIGWDTITDVRPGRIQLLLARYRGVGCIEVQFVNGATRRLRAAVGCSREATHEFLVAAAVVGGLAEG